LGGDSINARTNLSDLLIWEKKNDVGISRDRWKPTKKKKRSSKSSKEEKVAFKQDPQQRGKREAEGGVCPHPASD